MTMVSNARVAVLSALLLSATSARSIAQPPPPPSKKAMERLMATVPPDTLKKHRIPASALTDFHPVVALTIIGTSPSTIWVNHDYQVAYIVSNFTLQPVSGQMSGVSGAKALKAISGPDTSVTLQPGQSTSGEFQGDAGQQGEVKKVSLRFAQPLPCRPDGHGGQICPTLPIASGTTTILVNDVGEILSSRDSLPDIGDVDGNICHKALFARSTDTPNEWEETPGGHDVPVAGRVINAQNAGVDIPFDHPFVDVATGARFGYDYCFHIEPDQPYFSFLNAPGIASKADCSTAGLASGKWDGDTCAAFDIVRGQGRTPTGALHTEIEKGLIPAAYLPMGGDRIYARGRRIVDCGHPDYNVELHPPTLIARAWQDSTLGQVRSTLIATPYITRQTYLPGHSDFVTQVAGELAAVGLSPAPSPLHLLADVDDAPIDGNFQALYQVAIPPRHNFDKAKVSYHFVTRPGVTVVVQRLTEYQVIVLVTVDPTLYVHFGPPTCQTTTLTLSDAEKLGGLDSGALTDIYNKVVGVVASGVLTIFGIPPNVQINVAAAAGAGLLEYDCSVPNGAIPSPGSTMDNQVVVDPSQPYPVYGWLNIDWDSD
jgi:hypothetical protein